MDICGINKWEHILFVNSVNKYLSAYNITLGHISEQERHGLYPHGAYNLGEKMTLNKYYIIMYNYDKFSEGKCKIHNRET